MLTLEEIEQLLDVNSESVVVIDEAYIDFGGKTAISLVNKYRNLLVIQTLSKSRSLAGMRIGFAIGDQDLIEALVRVKDSFNSYPVGSLTISAAVAALKDQDYFEQTCQKIVASREWVRSELTALGFDVLPSAANFILAKHPQHDAADLAAALRQQGIIVRHFKQDRISQFLRITIGRTEENQQLLAVLDTLVD